jgi:DNA topoisomerase VI subunit B
MTGQPAERFPDVVFKELADNGFDAAEKAGVAPIVSVRLLRRGRLIWVAVRDNGRGIDPNTLKKILDFNTRTSDKAAYRAPTRGLQGNALKTIVGIPRALGVRAPIYIKSRGVLHRIESGIDPAGELRVKHDTQEVPHRAGTVVVVPLPASRCHSALFTLWARSFSLFNSHAMVRIWDSGAPCKQVTRMGARPAKTEILINRPSPSPGTGVNSCPRTSPPRGGTTSQPWRNWSSATSQRLRGAGVTSPSGNSCVSSVA